jgi:hypothetical protein
VLLLPFCLLPCIRCAMLCHVVPCIQMLQVERITHALDQAGFDFRISDLSCPSMVWHRARTKVVRWRGQSSLPQRFVSVCVETGAESGCELVEYPLKCWQVTWTTWIVMPSFWVLGLSDYLLPWAFPSTYAAFFRPVTGAWSRRHFPSLTKTGTARWVLLPFRFELGDLFTAPGELGRFFRLLRTWRWKRGFHLGGWNWVQIGCLVWGINSQFVGWKVLDSGPYHVFLLSI